ncbi:MAG: hypothetical protein IPP66_09395 [Anaerolineales bacterium]|nr:hypothetical protein [Anaerolineales bacterium]
MDLNIDYVESLAKRLLPLETWGFVESARTDSFLIYNSQWCRLRFNINVDHHNKSLFISYGRLHAADDKATIKWMGEDYFCWINESRESRILLQFLDGLTSEEAYKTSRERLKLYKDFEASVSASHQEINSVELQFMRHAMVWEHYGLRFFELFDLRRPDLWDDFINFLKEYFRLYYEKLDINLQKQGQKRTHHEIPPYRRC